MLHIFKLLRPFNLLIIALTQFLVLYCLISSTLQSQNRNIILSVSDFILLVLSTIFIASAGYVINDYFDIPSDKINKPNKLILDNKINHKMGIILHAVLSIIGICIGIFLALKLNMILLCFIQIFSAGILWFYSAYFKRRFLIGNITIAILTAIIPLLPALYEFAAEKKLYNTAIEPAFGYVMVYVIFAFLLTLIREIIKDLEDIEGDKLVGRRTLPLVVGINKTKTIVVVLLFITISLLGLFLIKKTSPFTSPGLVSRGLGEVLLFYYFLIAVIIPLLALGVKIFKAKEKQHFHLLSNISRIIMLTGILSTIVVYFF